MRLRQIALVARELRPVEQAICETLGLEVCYRDPGLAVFGLRHGLYPIGDRVLEVVVPKQPGTTAERFLDRRGGDGGYMVIVQVEDLDAERARLEAAGIRIAFDAKGSGIRGPHLHPKDVGGAIVSIDQADPPESWAWAGQDWAYHSRNDVVTDLVAVEIPPCTTMVTGIRKIAISQAPSRAEPSRAEPRHAARRGSPSRRGARPARRPTTAPEFAEFGPAAG